MSWCAEDDVKLQVNALEPSMLDFGVFQPPLRNSVFDSSCQTLAVQQSNEQTNGKASEYPISAVMPWGCVSIAV